MVVCGDQLCFRKLALRDHAGQPCSSFPGTQYTYSSLHQHYVPAPDHTTPLHPIYTCSIWAISQPRNLCTPPRLLLGVSLLDLAPKLHGYMPSGRDENTRFGWTGGLSTSSRTSRTKRFSPWEVGPRRHGISAHHRHKSGSPSHD